MGAWELTGTEGKTGDDGDQRVEKQVPRKLTGPGAFIEDVPHIRPAVKPNIDIHRRARGTGGALHSRVTPRRYGDRRGTYPDHKLGAPGHCVPHADLASQATGGDDAIIGGVKLDDPRCTGVAV